MRRVDTNRGLIIFARQPLPGHVKTRLAGEVGVRPATELYAAMLEDVLERAARLNGVRVLVFWAMENDPLPQRTDYPRLEMHRQCGGNLGERMAAALETAFAGGIRSCCVIGSDSPDLPPEYITRAFQLLEQDQADVVFGPAEDGGYYLVGMKRLWRRIFEDLAWGGNDVLESSCQRARELELRTALLPDWYDLDTLADLRKLAATSGREAPRTRQLLRQAPEILNCPAKESPA
jgi:rSAM/selenodomain-associated transferase 1